MNREIQFICGSIGLKEHILIMAMALRARFSAYISSTFLICATTLRPIFLIIFPKFIDKSSYIKRN